MAQDLYELIQDDVSVRDRGEVEIKGFGRRRIYTLEGMSDIALGGHDM